MEWRWPAASAEHSERERGFCSSLSLPGVWLSRWLGWTSAEAWKQFWRGNLIFISISMHWCAVYFLIAVGWAGNSFVGRVKRAATVQHADMPAKANVDQSSSSMLCLAVVPHFCFRVFHIRRPMILACSLRSHLVRVLYAFGLEFSEGFPGYPFTSLHCFPVCCLVTLHVEFAFAHCELTLVTLTCDFDCPL